MDGREAREIIKDSYKSDQRDEASFAHGYLAGMKDPSVVALVEALQKNGNHSQTCSAWVGKGPHRWSKLDESKCNCGLKEALLNYRQAVGEQGK